MGGRNVSYPEIFSIVCTRWRTTGIVHNTPSLWSYFSITDYTTLDDISISLRRSKSFPLSIRITILSPMTKRDRLQVQVDTMEIRMNIDSHPLRFGPALGIRMREEGPDPLRLERFEEKVSLLLQHTVRWRRFCILAAQPRFILRTMTLIANIEHKAPLLCAFCLQFSESRWDLIDLTPANDRTPPFFNAMPSLQRLALCCGMLPIPDSTSDSFLLRISLPGLKELELSKTEFLHRSQCLRILHSFPHLCVLKIMNIGFREDDLAIDGGILFLRTRS